MPTLLEKAEALRALHKGPRLLVLANVWAGASARIVAKAGFPALATSSAAVAYVYGYPDGQRITRDEMMEMVERIARAVPLPVSADVEAGYGESTEAAVDTARAVLVAGAVGINLEDTADDGRLLPLERQVERIRAARAAAEPLVINARTDVFGVEGIAPEGRMAEAVRRANAYLAAGADCAFVPWVFDPERITALVREVKGPLNVLVSPKSPPLAELERLGVRRASVGSGIARATYGLAAKIARELRDAGTYASLTEGAIPYAEMQQILRQD
ncbi:MAG: isocitrate lyase/phosphoenolpyruvate mutase family protein [Myxococcales bacterium]